MAHEPPYDASTYAPSSGRFLPSKCPPKTGGLSYSPSVLYFHFVGVDEVSDWQPFLITNTGEINMGLAIDAIANPEFEMRGVVPAVVQPGEIIELEVRFKPAGEGARLGEIIAQSGDGDPEPKVHLVGIGGTVSLNADTIINNTQLMGDLREIVTNLVSENILHRWAYRYGTFMVEDLTANELLMDYHVTATHTLQPNFEGCGVSVTVPPASALVMTVLKGDVPVGSITINPDGSIVKATNDGLAIDVPVNSVMTLKGPPTEDDSMGRFRVTFVGVVPLG